MVQDRYQYLLQAYKWLEEILKLLFGGGFKSLVSATPCERDLTSETKSCTKLSFSISLTNEFPEASSGMSTLNDRSSFLSSSEISPWSIFCKKKNQNFFEKTRGTLNKLQDVIQLVHVHVEK